MKKTLFIIVLALVALISCGPVTPEPDDPTQPGTSSNPLDSVLQTTFLGKEVLSMDALLGATSDEATAQLKKQGWTFIESNEFDGIPFNYYERTEFGETFALYVHFGKSNKAYYLDFATYPASLPSSLSKEAITTLFNGIGESRALSTGEKCDFLGMVDWLEYNPVCSGTYDEVADIISTLDNDDYSCNWGDIDLGAENTYYSEYLLEGEASGIYFEYSTVESEYFVGIVVASKKYK